MYTSHDIATSMAHLRDLWLYQYNYARTFRLDSDLPLEVVDGDAGWVPYSGGSQHSTVTLEGLVYIPDGKFRRSLQVAWFHRNNAC